MNKSHVFESPDGGKTIYRRTTGNAHRELIFEHEDIKRMRDQLQEDQLWQTIRAAASSDSELARMLENVKVYYYLKREN